MSSSSNSSPSSSSQTHLPSWKFKPLHEMTSTERLLSLQSWAEEKKFVHPGQGGTLNFSHTGIMRSLGHANIKMEEGVGKVNSGGDRYAGQHEAPVGPPSYEQAVICGEMKERRGSLVGRWIERRKTKMGKKEEEEKVPEYTP